MTVAVTNGVHKNVDDLYGDTFTVALAQAMSRLECAPYWHSGEKAPARLVRAGELVRHSRVQLHDERTATVHGSTKPYDITGFHCTCPQSQKGPSMWCVHSVAVKLARTMVEQAPRPTAPDTDEALGNGFPVDDETLPLPLPPMTVEERLALSTLRDSTALSTHHTPQEDRMADDGYIPEPDTDDAPVTVMEAPVSTRALTPVAQEDDLEQALTRWTAQRQIVQRFLKHQLIAGTDYYQLRIGKGESKPSLSKAGAEKVLSWLKWSASFTPDTGTWEMLGRPTNLVCYVCHLHTRSGEVVGEGRGARSVTKDNGDINKAIKMAEKSSMVSAVLRTGALSDCFTQDLEDMQEAEPAKATTPAKATSQDLRSRIWQYVTQHDTTVKTREDAASFVRARTGLELVPDNYAQILDKLNQVA